MRSTLNILFLLAALFGTIHMNRSAVAQDSAQSETVRIDETKASEQGRFPTMRPSPGVLVKVLRADELKGIESKRPRTATVLEVTLDPMAGSPPHRHPGPVCGYVLKGTFEFQVEGQEKRFLKAGDTFFEPEMILHVVGRNPSSEGQTRVLATIIHPADATQLVIPEPQPKDGKASGN